MQQTYQSPPEAALPSLLPPLASRLAFWPAAAEAKLEGRFDGIMDDRRSLFEKF